MISLVRKVVLSFEISSTSSISKMTEFWAVFLPAILSLRTIILLYVESRTILVIPSKSEILLFVKVRKLFSVLWRKLVVEVSRSRKILSRLIILGPNLFLVSFFEVPVISFLKVLTLVNKFLVEGFLVVVLSFIAEAFTWVGISIIVVVFFFSLHLTHMLDGTDWNQIKLLIFELIVDVPLSDSFPRKIFSGVWSYLVQLFDLLFKRQICSL